MSVPARIGRYTVRRRIGSGGFATVWLAYDEQLDSPVAVKVLAENWTEDHQVRQRFDEEGRYLRRVDSAYVVSVYDAGELDDGRPYLVMSYADQGTLADRLEVGALTTAQTLGIVRQVGAGLQALHERDILHRDVKPANVLLRTDGTSEGDEPTVRAMVADLGLGKALDMSSRLTMIAGTPTFVAPEQALGEHLDARADQYSLAALTYLLLAGRAPYAHASLQAAAMPGELAPLTCPELDLPPEVDGVVRRGLAPARENRWPDVAAYVEELTAALGPVVSGQAPALLPVDPLLTQLGAAPSPFPGRMPLAGPTEPPHESPRRSRRRTAALVAGLAAGVVGVAAATVGGYVVGHRPDPERTVTDRTGRLAATVPTGWDRESTRTWRPDPDADRAYPVLSIGPSRGWAAAGSDAPGLFVGLMPGSELPAQLPGHPECDSAAMPVVEEVDGRSATTVTYTGCPGGVTVERVVQVGADRLAWVQVRDIDQDTVDDVLGSVTIEL